jgi:SHS2 domain-containing protein
MTTRKNNTAGVPAESSTEKALSWTAVFLSSVPFPLVAPIGNILGKITADKKFERIQTALNNLVKDFKKYKTEEMEAYVQTDEFEELIENTLKRLWNERNAKKRRLYRAFLIGSIKAPGGDYDIKLRFLRCLEDLHWDEFIVLKVLSEKASYPSIHKRRSLRNDGLQGIQRPTLLTLLPQVNAMTMDEAVERLNILGITMIIKNGSEIILTPFGTRFVEFISSD